MEYTIKNKKALSLMVGYVLLIVIAISLAAIVYPFLKQYLPFDKEECPSDVFLSIEDVQCNATSGILSVTLSNRGLFTIQAVYTKMAKPNQSAFTSFPISNLHILPDGNKTVLYYNLWTISNPVNFSDIPTGGREFTIKVQPVMLSKKNQIIACPSSVTETIVCKKD